eukprot:147273-Amphidinium_carterae.2
MDALILGKGRHAGSAIVIHVTCDSRLVLAHVAEHLLRAALLEDAEDFEHPKCDHLYDRVTVGQWIYPLIKFDMPAGVNQPLSLPMKLCIAKLRQPL